MTIDLDDQAMAHRLRAELEGARYQRTAGAFAPRSRTPFVVGLASVAAVAVVVGVTGQIGTASPALAWSPTPSAATAADEAAAAAACSFTPDDEMQRPGNGAASPSLELPPLVSLDLRGTGGLATFADDQMVVTCLLVRDGDGFQRGPLVGESTDSYSDNGEFGIAGATSTEWSDGTTISMITGVAPTGAATVAIDIAGQATATATVTDGRFGMWWFGTVENLYASVTALDADGAEIARTDIGSKVDDSDGARG